MRRLRLPWFFLVVSTLLILYGGFFAIRSYKRNPDVLVFAIVALSVGTIMLITFIVLHYLFKKKTSVNNETPVELSEEIPVEPIEEVPQEEEKEEEETRTPSEAYYESPNPSGSSSSGGYRSYGSSIYVKQVGYGPILEIYGNRFRDMRSGQYYRIENDRVFQEGGGVMYEISSNRIRNINGNLSFEISGDNINKVFGGFFASISGNYITTHDLSVKLEMTERLNNKQILLVCILVFGE